MLILSTVYVHSTDSVVLRIAVSLGFGTKPLTWPCQVPKRDDDVLQHLYFYNVFLGMSHLGVKEKNEAILESFFEITNLVAAALVPHCREE